MTLITDRRLHVALAAALLVRGSLFGWDAGIVAALVLLGCLAMVPVGKSLTLGSRRPAERKHWKHR